MPRQCNTALVRGLLCSAVFTLGIAGSQALAQTPDEYYIGSSMNFASYLQDHGVVYKEGGVPTDPYASIAAHGGNIVRLEDFLGPYENQYTSGYGPVDWGAWSRVKNDVANAASYGLDTFLTFTFKSQASQIEAGAQNNMPDAWAGLSDSQVAQHIYDTTYAKLNELGQMNLLPKFVSIGNEINGAFVERPNTTYSYDAQRITDMMNAGFDAVRDIAALYGTTIHSAAHIYGPDNIDWWLNTANSTGLNDFDTVALSYYPGWHSFNDFNSMAELAQWAKNAYGKNVFILETAQSFSSGYGDSRDNVYTYNPNPGQPLTPAVQRQFLADMASDLISGGGLGVITWGTDWVSSDGVLPYADQWFPPPGSTWENNAYWDFNNNLHEGIDWMADVRAMYPLPLLEGDLNGDGYVGLDDLQPILDHWNQYVTVGDVSMGDIAGPGGSGPDGYVGLDDLQPVLDHWNEGALPIDSAIPEPCSLAIWLVTGAVLHRRNRLAQPVNS